MLQYKTPTRTDSNLISCSCGSELLHIIKWTWFSVWRCHNIINLTTWFSHEHGKYWYILTTKRFASMNSTELLLSKCNRHSIYLLKPSMNNHNANSVRIFRERKHQIYEPEKWNLCESIEIDLTSKLSSIWMKWREKKRLKTRKHFDFTKRIPVIQNIVWNNQKSWKYFI